MDDPKDLKRLGNRLLASRDVKGAKATFESLISLYPDEIDGYLGLAKVFDRQRDFEGIVKLIKPIEGKFHSWKLKKALAQAYGALSEEGKEGYLDSAIEYYEAYHREKKDPVTLYHLGFIYETMKRDYLRALHAYQLSWDNDPKNRFAYEGVLRCLKSMGRHSDVDSIKEVWREREGN